MGYMGFGMRKDSYTRKPRVPFSHVKNIYGKNLEKFDRVKSSDSKRTISRQDHEYIKRRTRKRLQLEQLIQNGIKVILFVGVIAIAVLAIISLKDTFDY